MFLWRPTQREWEIIFDESGFDSHTVARYNTGSDYAGGLQTFIPFPFISEAGTFITDCDPALCSSDSSDSSKSTDSSDSTTSIGFSSGSSGSSDRPDLCDTTLSLVLDFDEPEIYTPLNGCYILNYTEGSQEAGLPEYAITLGSEFLPFTEIYVIGDNTLRDWGNSLH